MTQLIPAYDKPFSSILLFGPPGSGKGTLGKFLASAGAQYHLSSGDIFRKLPASSPAGKLFHDYARQGKLLPDQETIEIVKHYINGLTATNAFCPQTQDLLLDGIPRTRAQAEILTPYIKVRHIIVLESSNTEELFNRMQKRSVLEGRFDDVDINVLKARMEIYNKQVDQILDFYPDHLVSRVDALQKPLEVLSDVLVRLAHLLSHGPM